jgi:hypothetical protein
MISRFEKWGWHGAAPLGDLANFTEPLDRPDAGRPPHERSGSSLELERS